MPSTAPPPSPPAQDGSAAAPSSAGQTVGYEEFIDKRIAETRSAVKLTDIATSAAGLLAWGLGLLLLAAIAEHWLVTGGFSRGQRFALFAVGLIGAGAYAARRLVPLVLRRVNPLYAAREIERESPELKNSLVNLLQLRRDRSTSSAHGGAVKQVLERQAAERLASAGEGAIDRTPAVRVAQTVLVLVAAIGVYVVASPKDFFASAGRVLAPWADITAPTRVRIASLEPGDLKVAQGERVTVSAMVTGLREDERVELVYSTSDGRVVDRRVTMRASESGLHHSARLPEGSGAAAALGLQSEVTYRLAAGDARSPLYRIEVLTAPTIAPVAVRYVYPGYTGYSPREVEGVGDLRAIEGTRVELTAEANLPIESAQLDLGADGRNDARLRPDGRRATGKLTLRRPADAVGDSSTSYVLRFTSTDGQANNSPPQYRVEVIADLPPEAAVLEPEQATIEVAVNEPVTVVAEARDPDFLLSEVRLVGESSGRNVLGIDLPVGDGRGRFVRDATIVPGELGLRPGDVLDYWVEAIDNRSPEPNRGASERRQLRVVDPSERQGGDPRNQQGADGQPAQGGEANRGDNGDPSGAEGGDPRDAAGSRGDSGENGASPSGDPAANGRNPQVQPGDDPDEGSGEEGSPPPAGPTGPGQSGSEGESGQPLDGAASEGSSQGEDQGEQTGNGGAAGERSSSSSSEGGNPEDDRNGAQAGGQPREEQRGQQEGSSESDEPVARDGSDDGQAFKRIKDFLEQQERGSEADGAESDPQEDSGPSEERSGDPSGLSDGRETNDAGDPAGSDSEQPSDSSDASDGRAGSDEGEFQPRDGEPGAQPERDGSSEGPGEGDRSGESSDSTSSESGGESPPGERDDRANRPRDGAASPGQNQASDQGAGQSADRGAGDSTGEAGGEQRSDSPTGRPGSDQAGDGSRSREAEGDLSASESSDGGESQPRNNGSQNDGSQQQQGDGNDGAANDGSEGARPNNSQGSQPGQQPPSGDSPAGDSSQETGDPQAGGEATGGEPGEPQGLAQRGDNSSAGGAGSEVGGDAANLDDAREQTELVLERLADQLRDRDVDRELLDKLGWSEQDLRRFVERWQSRQRRAADRGAEGQAELDRALRSLGLDGKGPTARSQTPEDRLRDLRQRSRTKPPSRLRDALERYNRSLNEASDE